jgi:hypothetical protein
VVVQLLPPPVSMSELSEVFELRARPWLYAPESPQLVARLETDTELIVEPAGMFVAGSV